MVHTFTNPKTGAKEQWKLVNGKAQKTDSWQPTNSPNPLSRQSRAAMGEAIEKLGSESMKRELAKYRSGLNTPEPTPAVPSSTSTPSTDRREHR